MAAGEPKTTWFERHGITPITELPAEWPDGYRRLVERRIELIESDPNIRLIEQPEYKRRWNTEPWESQLERALRDWLLDRLERYFDFDGRMNDEGKPTARARHALTSVAKLADVARRTPTSSRSASFTATIPRSTWRSWSPSWSRPRACRCCRSCVTSRRAWQERGVGEDLGPAAAGGCDRRPHEAGQERSRTPFRSGRERTLKKKQVGTIPVPPKYTSADFLKGDYWRLRGKLDVPKERWVSFPHCEGEDGTLVVAWAG